MPIACDELDSLGMSDSALIHNKNTNMNSVQLIASG